MSERTNNLKALREGEQKRKQSRAVGDYGAVIFRLLSTMLTLGYVRSR